MTPLLHVVLKARRSQTCGRGRRLCRRVGWTWNSLVNLRFSNTSLSKRVGSTPLRIVFKFSTSHPRPFTLGKCCILLLHDSLVRPSCLRISTNMLPCVCLIVTACLLRASRPWEYRHEQDKSFLSGSCYRGGGMMKANRHINQ